MSKLTASVVSRRLARAGLRPLASGTTRMREGLRVSQSYAAVRVVADLNSQRDAAALAAAAREALTGAGFTTETRLDESAAFYVTGR